MRQSENQMSVRSNANRGLVYGPGSGFAGAFESPWGLMERMRQDMDQLFGQFFGSSGPFASFAPFPGGQGNTGQDGTPALWQPSIDVSQTDKEWRIDAELPGVTPDDIRVDVENQSLRLQAELKQESPDENTDRQYAHRERRYGYFERVLPLPENVDEEHISCSFKDGVLSIQIPKKPEARPAVRRIPVNAGKAASGSQAQLSSEASSHGGQSAHSTNGHTAGSNGNGQSANEQTTPVGAGSKGK